MKATTAREIPRGPQWVYEPKYDGVRVLAVVERGGVELRTRNGNDKAADFPEVTAASETGEYANTLCPAALMRA